MELNSGCKLDFPATARNREAIAAALSSYLSENDRLSILEIASGSGQHVRYLAERFPLWTFQPTDLSLEHVKSVAAYRADFAGINILEPLVFDVTSDCPPTTSSFDAVFAINLIHISPWQATLSLFSHSAKILTPGGCLYLYGAFKRNGQHTAPSNAAFDKALRERNSQWGVRSLEDVSAAASGYGFELSSVMEMPSNNLSIWFSMPANLS